MGRFVRRWLARLGLAVAAAGILPVACCRWVDPPMSTLMGLRWLEARAEGRVPRFEYHWVPLERIAPSLHLAVVAAEDQRFPHHRGFDLTEVAEALEDAGTGGRVRGASTLTQQMCKNLFLWPARSWVRKSLEAWLTVVSETLLPKRRILEIYLNVVEFGDGVYGAEAASRRFFGHGANALELHEASLLAAALPNPRRLRLDPPGEYVQQRAAIIRRQVQQLGPRWLDPL